MGDWCTGCCYIYKWANHPEQGTTLEDVCQIDIASSLWSSEALIKNPESVIEAHLLFLRAGARLIETAS